MAKFHKLADFVKTLDEKGLLVKYNETADFSDETVKYISFNSQDIKKDTLFVCKGVHFKEQYLADALERGAFAYVSEKEIEAGKGVPSVIVSDIRKTMVVLAELFFDSAWKKLTVTGITGTKGKSSTTYFMKYIIDEYMAAQGKPESAVISGIDNYDGVVLEESHLTTPEAMELHQHFDNAVSTGIEFASMEISSTALKFGRVEGIIFDIGCFLNIGTDHISDVEHPDFDDYVSSKMILFDQCRNVCVNMESEYAAQVIERAENSDVTEKILRFGRSSEDYDVYGYDIRPDDDGISFKVRTKNFDRDFRITMHGLFNVDNALCAIAASEIIGIPADCIASGLLKARVSGRMEIFRNGTGTKTAIVDYAHNQMSFESLFDTIRKEFSDKEIFIVYGCPGKKAIARRKELAEVAGKYSKKVFITEEDPGEESVDAICEEIAVNIKAEGADYEIITDRVEAIKQAIDEMNENTILLITGKGRETRQKRGVEYIDTPSDVEVVEEEFSK